MSLNLKRRFATALWYLKASLAMRRARADSSRRVAVAVPCNILVVCYGNIYRSAFVAEYLRTHLDSRMVVRSAGFHPEGGRSSPDRHVLMCEELGVQLADHRSSVIVPTNLQWAGLIVLMDRSNWIQLRRMGAPEEKLVWLGAWASGGDLEVADPYRLDDSAARRELDRIYECSRAMTNAISRAMGNR